MANFINKYLNQSAYDADSTKQYLPENITTITRELMSDLSTNEISTGTFALSYTVLPSPIK